MKKIIKKETKKEEVKCCCKNSKNVCKIHLIALVLILGVAMGLYFRFWNIVTVNGKGISRAEYYKKLAKSDAKQLLDQMITEMLIKEEALKKNIKIEQSEIDEEIKKIDEQIKGQGQTLELALTAQGMTKAELENQISLQKMVDKLSNPNTEITQVQIDEFLKTNKAQLPAKATKDELQKLAKDELTSQASQSAIGTWLEGLKNGANIIYK